ncbi:uncharacterized protein [Triticum aestivum]|uniref:uncharacterized protein isoform X1 n=1 Tax=Triticum aestivum TaxID=4565 RepID=UPI001D016ACE|nr:uncharacterized protein LOC123063565 isoform X1 [Triticum aestivum]
MATELPCPLDSEGWLSGVRRSSSGCPATSFSFAFSPARGLQHLSVPPHRRPHFSPPSVSVRRIRLQKSLALESTKKASNDSSVSKSAGNVLSNEGTKDGPNLVSCVYYVVSVLSFFSSV